MSSYPATYSIDLLAILEPNQTTRHNLFSDSKMWQIEVLRHLYQKQYGRRGEVYTNSTAASKQANERPDRFLQHASFRFWHEAEIGELRELESG